MKTDTQIQKEVMQELSWDPSVTHEHIGVSASDGVVTLSGTVPSYIEKLAAEKAAERVAGVKGVVEKIEVELIGDKQRSDEDIAHAAIEALKWNVEVPNDRVKVSVRNGRVELVGDLEWEYQKNAAENAVKNLIGVTWVLNNIEIKSKVSPSNVKEKIELALKRAAEREARRIRVDVKDGKVTLSGEVRSFSELRDAKGAAWSAPGVTQVENRLHLEP